MAWSRIQSAKGSGFGTTAAATFTANVSSGTKIIAVVGSSWRDPPTSVTDGASNSWTLLGSHIPASNGGSCWLYALDTPAGDVGTKPTLTVTFPSSNGQSIVIQEVSGLATGNTSAMLDGSPAGLDGATASTGSPSYTSTAANEYLVCIFGNSNQAATLVAGGSLSLDANNVTNQSHASVEFGNSSNGAETSGFTGANTTGQWSILTVAFKLASSGSHTDTGALVVTPTRANTLTHGHNPTAALTVSPSRSNTLTHAHNPTAALVVAPVRTAVRQHAATIGAALVIRPSFGAATSGGRKTGGNTPDRARWWK